MTISAFYLFESLYTTLFSLSKGKGNLFVEDLSIPNWGGHWSYTCAWMYVYAMCGCVCVLESLQGVPVALLILSGKLSWYIYFFSDAPLWRQVQLRKYTLSFPCWQLSLLFMLTRTGKGRTLDVNMPLGLCSLEFHLKVKNFLATVLRASVLSYSVWLALVWSGQKRHEGAPWRFSVGMTSLQNTFCSLGNSWGVAT